MARFSKKHYEFLAKFFAYEISIARGDKSGDGAVREQVTRGLVGLLGARLRDDNPKFDYAQFVGATEPKPQPVVETYDITGNIIAYETGELDQDEQVILFQHLIDSGMAWSLQGHYGRMAHDLIKAGVCTLKGGK